MNEHSRVQAITYSGASDRVRKIFKSVAHGGFSQKELEDLIILLNTELLIRKKSGLRIIKGEENNG